MYSTVQLQSALEVLATQEQELGADHPELIRNLDRVAEISHALSRHSEAESFYRRALRIKRQTAGYPKPELLTSLHRLAVLYRIQEKFAQAEEIYLETLTLSEMIYGADHNEVATRINYLAGLYNASEYYAKAEQCLLRSLKIYQANTGVESYVSGLCLLGLALVCVHEGKQSEAQTYYAKAADILRSDVKVELAGKLISLALVYFGQERYTDAEVLLRHALVLDEEALWSYHPLVPVSLMILGDLCAAQGLFNEAEIAYRSAIEKQVNGLGEQQAALLDSLEKLARFYTARDRREEAAPLVERAVSIAVELYGPSDMRTANWFAKCAMLHDRLGMGSKANVLRQQAMEIKRRAQQ
jgi:tetratricopeptide (TPR) repeat protein